MIMSCENIEMVEEKYNAKYVGRYDLDRGTLDYTVMGAVFYVETPDVSKGHSNYFALFHDPFSGDLLITNASNVAENKYPAIQLDGDGQYLVSRGRHDYVVSGGAFLDGGHCYTKYNPAIPPTHVMRIVDGVETFTEINNET